MQEILKSMLGKRFWWRGRNLELLVDIYPYMGRLPTLCIYEPVNGRRFESFLNAHAYRVDVRAEVANPDHLFVRVSYDDCITKKARCLVRPGVILAYLDRTRPDWAEEGF